MDQFSFSHPFCRRKRQKVCFSIMQIWLSVYRLCAVISEALEASTVKIAGKDVLATWKILISLGVVPILYAIYAILATIIAIKADAPLNWRVAAPFLTIVLLPIMSFAALKFGEAGMDILKWVHICCVSGNVRYWCLPLKVVAPPDSYVVPRAKAASGKGEKDEGIASQRIIGSDQWICSQDMGRLWLCTDIRCMTVLSNNCWYFQK